MESSVGVSLPYDAAVPCRSTYPNYRIPYYRDICPSMFSDIHNSKGMESAYIPISTWVNNENAVHTYNEVLSHKKVKPWQVQENGCNCRSLY